MTVQTITIGKRRFVLVAERDFKQLQKQARKPAVQPAFARAAVRDLQSYRKTRKASDWSDVKRKLGL